ncbi:hypothetical protein ACFY3U_16750 [Micromonospora sp. NPDC000089]|uniref:hypothetical protein n=1 Tax=unclassified Micromonospora TaxID=2617518 RepID=UPI0036819768
MDSTVHDGAPGPDGRRRWTPAASLALAAVSVAVAVVGAYLLRRPDELGRFTGPTLYVLAQLGLAYAMNRATMARAGRFAALGVPTAWTRPPVRGVVDPELRRWENTIRGLRQPVQDDVDLVVTAARARAEGLSPILVPGLLSVPVGVVGLALGLRDAAATLSALLLLNAAIGVLLGVATARYGVDGRRARAYLARLAPDGTGVGPRS